MQCRPSRFLVAATAICALSFFSCDESDESTPLTAKGSGGTTGKGGSQSGGAGGNAGSSQGGGASGNAGGSQSGGVGGKVGGNQNGGAGGKVGGSQNGGAGGNTGGTQNGGSGGNTGGKSVAGGTTSSGGAQSGGAPVKGGSTGSDAAGTGGAVSGGTSGSGGSTGAGGSTAPIDMKRFRYMHSSDFPPIPVTNSDPDDVQTVIRLLLYSNDLDIEGFIASAGTYGMVAKKSNYETLWAAYETVYPNLLKHDPKYPTPAAIRAMTYQGKGNGDGFSIKWGCNEQPATSLIGAGKDSEASNAIIKAADKADPRPLWIGVAGGPREVAQAIWDVRNTRSEDAVKLFISKLRVFLIACQDGTDQYIMSVPGLFVIDSKTSYLSFCCGNDSKCNSGWVESNIRSGHGPLGALYPARAVCSAGVAEGDTPAFMHLISAMNGVNNPEVPSEAGWGGQYKLKSDNKWVDGGGGKIVSGRATYQEEFAKRADWMVQ